MEFNDIINSRNLKVATGVLGAATLISFAVDMIDPPNSDIDTDLDKLVANEPMDAFSENA